MSLLTEIQAAATDPTVSLSDLLRKCQILAFRLRHEPFKQWVSHELNGYPDEATLPTYRGPFDGAIKADTHGAFGAEVRNVGVPDWSIPAEVRDDAKEMSFTRASGPCKASSTTPSAPASSWWRPSSRSTWQSSPRWSRTNRRPGCGRNSLSPWSPAEPYWV